MSTSNCVSIHPYFKAKEGKLADLKALCPNLVELCSAEEKCLYYGFCFNGDVMACREAFDGAEGVLAHLDNAGDAVGGLFEVADLERIEVHGPAAELEKLKEPLKDLNPTYFTLEFGA